MKPHDMTDTAMVHYAHKESPTGQRFRQYKKDPLPSWAVDVRDEVPPHDMTDEQLRVRVAELLNLPLWWSTGDAGHHAILDGAWVHGVGDAYLDTGAIYKHHDGTKWPIVCPLKDYPHDLNACHEVEVWLPHDRRGEYAIRILGKVGGDLLHENGLVNNNTLFATANATARQRCEAFVEVMEAK